MTKFWEQPSFTWIFLTKPIISNAYIMHIWTESNRKKRGQDFRTGCGYTMESFGRLQNSDIAFLFIDCYD